MSLVLGCYWASNYTSLKEEFVTRVQTLVQSVLPAHSEGAGETFYSLFIQELPDSQFEHLQLLSLDGRKFGTAGQRPSMCFSSRMIVNSYLLNPYLCLLQPVQFSTYFKNTNSDLTNCVISFSSAIGRIPVLKFSQHLDHSFTLALTKLHCDCLHTCSFTRL